MRDNKNETEANHEIFPEECKTPQPSFGHETQISWATCHPHKSTECVKCLVTQMVNLEKQVRELQERNADIFYVIQDGVVKKVTLAQMVACV